MSLALASALRALALALDLALRAMASALVLALRVLVLGLEGPGLDYKHVNFILWDVSCQCVSPIFSKFRLSMQCTVDPFQYYFLTIRHFP